MKAVIYTYGPISLSLVASARNRTIIPIANPIPNIGAKLERVVCIEINPADAEVPIELIPAKTGITMKVTNSASRTNRGRVMTSSDMDDHR